MSCRSSLAIGMGVCFLLVTAFSVGAVELKLAHYAPETHPGQKASLMFAEGVAARTNGAVTVKVYPNNALGSPPEQLEQTKLGTVDMSLPTQGALDKYVKEFAVVMLPFVYDGYEHCWKVLDGPFNAWVAPKLESQDLVLLSNWEWGFRNLTNNVRPVKLPEDMKGMKIRTPPELQLQAAMEACGAVVTKIAFPELYMALKQGVVDGQENPLAVIFHNKYYEAQKYLTLTRHVYNSMVHVISKRTWDKLTPDQQKVVKEESTKAGQFFRKAIVEEEKALVSELKSKGMDVVEQVDLAKFRQAMGPAYERIGAYAGEENVKKFMKMVQETK
jgi:TRAP-type transport system periplasmic protein